MQNTIRISEDFLNMVVNALTQLPYAEAMPIFERLAVELAPENQDPEPQIIVN
jgi:hypothetical protein